MDSKVLQTKWFRWVGVVTFGLIVGLLVVIVINTRPKSGNQQMIKVEAEVSRHVLLPADETPALATVTDPSKLGSDSFLKQAKKGDEILIYAKWQRAVLYRPSIDRVIDIGPVNVSPPGGNTSGYTPLK